MSNKEFEPIRIVEIIANETGSPRNDGMRGSALYNVNLRLSAPAPTEWARFFVEYWNDPESSTSMHRAGSVSVLGERVHFEKTTLEEIENTHKPVLKAAAEKANKLYVELIARRRESEVAEAERLEQHRQHVAEKAKKITFD